MIVGRYYKQLNVVLMNVVLTKWGIVCQGCPEMSVRGGLHGAGEEEKRRTENGERRSYFFTAELRGEDAENQFTQRIGC